MTLSELGTERTIGPNQEDTLFCWLFAIANSIYSSMWAKLDMLRLFESVFNKLLKNIPDRKAEKFLNQQDLTRIIRREICFGLIPKTLKRKFS